MIHDIYAPHNYQAEIAERIGWDEGEVIDACAHLDFIDVETTDHNVERQVWHMVLWELNDAHCTPDEYFSQVSCLLPEYPI